MDLTTASSPEILRLKSEVHAKDEALNALKVKTKAFVDNMRLQLSTEAKKVALLEEKLKDATQAAHQEKQQALETTEKLKNEWEAREKELQTRISSQYEAEKDKCRRLEMQLQQQTTDLAAAQAAKTTFVHEMDFFSSPTASSSHTDEEFHALQSQLTAANFEMADLKARLQTVEEQARHSSHQVANLQQELATKANEMLLSHTDTTKIKDLETHLDRYKVDTQRLETQLSDTQMELDLTRRRADENESIVRHLEAEKTAFACGKCSELETKLTEISQLYEKVNLGRSRSDSLLAESQSQLEEMQSIHEQFHGAQERLDKLLHDNQQLNETLSEKNSLITTLQNEITQWKHDMTELNERHTTQSAAFQQTIHELSTSIETMHKETNDKRQKAKVLVQTLVSEKASLGEASNMLQKEVERLRMELNQRKVEHDEQLKHIRDETNEKTLQSAATIHHLTDQVTALQHTLVTVQESEKVQQRAKELATAKREIDDSNKKRLAAKAETQKLALELENAHKWLDQLLAHVNAQCTDNIQQMALVQGHVKEALEVLETRTSGQHKRLPPQTDELKTMDSLRKTETVSGIRSANAGLNPGAKRLEENIARVSHQVQLLVDITERLCDLAVEQNEAKFKDLLLQKLTQTFTQCFAARLHSLYSKADEAVSLLNTHGTTSETSGTAVVRPSN